MAPNLRTNKGGGGYATMVPKMEQDTRRQAALEMLQNLATANNQAAYDIVQGDNLQAFRAIRSAAGQVSLLTPLLTECEDPSSAPTSPSSVASQDKDQLYVQPIYASDVWSIAHDNECYVFSCPFSIRPFTLTELASHVTLRYMKMLSSVAIYNMALSCHLQYRIAENCLKKEVLANRAMALYVQAATLLDECWVYPEESVYLVRLAICNNLIEVCLAEGHLYQAKRWKERLDEAIQRAYSCPALQQQNNTTASLLHYFKDALVIYAGTFAAARAA